MTVSAVTNEEITIRPQAGPQESFLSSPADIVIYGGAAGSGKTFGLLMDPLQYITTVKGFGAVIFRRTTPQITAQGGLWDTAGEIYPQIGATPNSTDLKWTFPPHRNGVKFAHLEYDRHVYDYQGSQIPAIYFDELTHFSEKQFWYLLSRNRSVCGVRPYVRATTNPDPESWVAKFISWWIDPRTGYPIDSRSGVIRWFVRDGNELIWSDTEEELKAKYPDRQPKSVTFIPAKLADNPILEKINPEYRGNLQALSFVEQERLLRGNWKIKAEAGTVFKREWFGEPVDTVPSGQTVRYWDMAATRKSKKSGDPDWTAGVKMCHANGIYYVMDVYRIRDNPGETEKARRTITAQDGPGVKIREEQEGGSSGKTVIFLAARDQFKGADYMGVPSSGSKQARSVPASRAAYNGLIKIKRSPWNDLLLAELEVFPDGKHDDVVDAFSGAFNELAKGLRDHTREAKIGDAVASSASGDDDLGINFDDELGEIW